MLLDLYKDLGSPSLITTFNSLVIGFLAKKIFNAISSDDAKKIAKDQSEDLKRYVDSEIDKTKRIVYHSKESLKGTIYDELLKLKDSILDVKTKQ